jgi:hypothetical protein
VCGQQIQIVAADQFASGLLPVITRKPSARDRARCRALRGSAGTNRTGSWRDRRRLH